MSLPLYLWIPVGSPSCNKCLLDMLKHFQILYKTVAAPCFTEGIKLLQKSSCWKSTDATQKELALPSYTRHPRAMEKEHKGKATTEMLSHKVPHNCQVCNVTNTAFHTTFSGK